MKRLFNIKQSNKPQIYSLSEATIDEKEKISQGKNEDKIIVKKIHNIEGNENKQKYKNSWMAKRQGDVESVNEIISAEIFELFLGNKLAPKYRLAYDAQAKIWSVTKLLENFEPASKILGNKGFEYNKKYIELIPQLENFEDLLATCFLMGKNDIHAGNWGIIEYKDKKFVATIDHGNAFANLDIEQIMCFYSHRTEAIATKKFSNSCIKIANDFDKNKKDIIELIKNGIQKANEFYNNDNFYSKDNPRIVQEPNYYLDRLESNKEKLKQLSYQIDAELAIREGNIDDFRNALNKIDSKHLILSRNEFGIFALSKQANDKFRYDDNFESKNFILLIETRLENNVRNKVFTDPRNKERTNKYLEKMSEKDKEIETKLLEIYFEVAKAKSPHQSRIKDERNQSIIQK